MLYTFFGAGKSSSTDSPGNNSITDAVCLIYSQFAFAPQQLSNVLAAGQRRQAQPAASPDVRQEAVRTRLCDV